MQDLISIWFEIERSYKTLYKKVKENDKSILEGDELFWIAISYILFFMIYTILHQLLHFRQ